MLRGTALVSWSDEAAQVAAKVTFIGQDVAEVVHAATIAVVGRVPVERLRQAIPSSPTMSEMWLCSLEESDQ